MRPNRPTVLLVEDDAHMRRAVTRHLTTRGLTVIPVACAADALDTAGADIAIVDIGLPDMDGVSLAVTLLTRFRASRIIFFTAETDEPTLARAALLGPVIPKDKGIDALLDVLSKHMR